MKLFIIIISCYFFIACDHSVDRSLTHKNIQRSQHMPIELTKAEFDEMLKSNVLNFNQLDVANAIDVVRVYNTINRYNLKDSIYSKFVQEVDEKYLYDLCRILKFKKWKGGALYSKEYDIFLGGPKIQKNSYFNLKNK